MLRAAEYDTVYKGKFHLNHHFNTRDEVSPKNWELSGSEIIHSKIGKGRVVTHSHADSLEQYGFSDWTSHGDFFGGAHEGNEVDPAYARDACEWITQRGEQQQAATARGETNKPWLLAVNFINPHDIMFFEDSEEQRNSRRQERFRGTAPFASYPDDPQVGDQWTMSGV
jgi:arylsulfatase